MHGRGGFEDPRLFPLAWAVVIDLVCLSFLIWVVSGPVYVVDSAGPAEMGLGSRAGRPGIVRLVPGAVVIGAGNGGCGKPGAPPRLQAIYDLVGILKPE